MNPSLRYSLTYGLLSGAVIAAVITVGLIIGGHGGGIFGTLWFGYLVMLVALTFIFVGVKRYRDIERGGVIRFFPAFGLGLAIAVCAGVAYVAVWETYLAITNYAFMDSYIAGAIRKLHEGGVIGAELAKQTADLEAMRTSYANPLIRLPMTFLEIFPVGLVVALVSAIPLSFPKFMPARA